MVTEQLIALLLVLQFPTVAVSSLGKNTEMKLPEIKAFDVVKVRLYWLTVLTLSTVGESEADVRGPTWQVYVIKLD